MHISCPIRANDFDKPQTIQYTGRRGPKSLARIGRHNLPNLNLKRFERSYLKMSPFGNPWGIGPRNIDTPLVQDTKLFSHIEMVWYEVVIIASR